MTKKNYYIVASLLSLIALFTGCTSSSTKNAPESKLFKVQAESYLLDDNGKLTLLPDAYSLRADLDKPQGRISGLGEYPANTSVTVKAERKSGYRLINFYEKNGKNGFSQQKGVVSTTSSEQGMSKVKDVSSTLTFTCLDDMSFVAVFYKEGSSTVTDLIIEGNVSPFRAQDAPSQKLGLKGKKRVPLLDNSNAEQQSREEPLTDFSGVRVVASSDWVNAKIEGNKLVVVPKSDYITKSPARTATVTISQDGVQKTITVSQNSYYKANSNSETTIVDENGSVITLPSGISHEFNSRGGEVSLTAKEPKLGKKMYLSVPVYENGTIVRYEDKVLATVNYGAPSQSWVSKRGSEAGKYGAGANNTGRSRNAAQSISITASNYKGYTIAVSYTQQNATYTIGGEIR